jgi:hypothetical protein
MERGSLKTSIDELFMYFRYKTIAASEVVDQWYPKVRHIPAEAMPWIVDEIEKLDALPRNIPKTILAYWYQWKKQHPEKIVFVKENCPDCNDGYLIISKIWEGQTIPTQVMVECGRCNNLDARFNSRLFTNEKPLNKADIFRLARHTRHELEMIGYDIIYPPKATPDGDRIPTPSEVRGFLEQIQERLGLDVAEEAKKRERRKRLEHQTAL